MKALFEQAQQIVLQNIRLRTEKKSSILALRGKFPIRQDNNTGRPSTQKKQPAEASTKKLRGTKIGISRTHITD